MGNKVFKRLFTLMLAVVMVLASSMAVLAAETGTQGNQLLTQFSLGPDGTRRQHGQLIPGQRGTIEKSFG